jgi:hypothetical protein
VRRSRLEGLDSFLARNRRWFRRLGLDARPESRWRALAFELVRGRGLGYAWMLALLVGILSTGWWWLCLPYWASYWAYGRWLKGCPYAGKLEDGKGGCMIHPHLLGTGRDLRRGRPFLSPMSRCVPAFECGPMKRFAALGAEARRESESRGGARSCTESTRSVRDEW